MSVLLLCSYIDDLSYFLSFFLLLFLAVKLFCSNEGKYISPRIPLAHHLHMLASTILLLT